MNEDIQEIIKDITLNFFHNTQCKIIEHDGIFQIIISEQIKNFLDRNNLLISFDVNKILSDDCELFVPGNHLLFKLMNLCITKGPITTGITDEVSEHNIIRFYFYVHFQGINDFSNLSFVDVSIDSNNILFLPNNITIHKSSSSFFINDEQINSCYLNALEQIKLDYSSLQESFLTSAKRVYDDEIKKLNQKYDALIDEIDSTIRKKDARFEDLRYLSKKNTNKISDLVTLENKNVDMINDSMNHIIDLREEKLLIEKTLDVKHSVLLEYGLVALLILNPDHE